MTLKLLIADDSTTIQKVVVLAFGCEDAVVECVSSGDVALDAIRASKPDVVLADISMPGLSGYEVCARIKEDPGLAQIPVLLLTGTYEPFDEAEASRVKCDGHLTKPFDTSELVETVRSLADKRTAAQPSDASVETPVMDMHTKVDSAPGLHGSVSSLVWDSYLGSDRILDLFDREVIKAAETLRPGKVQSIDNPTPRIAVDVKRFASAEEMLSEDALNFIVDKVMQRMSSDIIREVAWEVVPELSESIIRRTIEEQDKS